MDIDALLASHVRLDGEVRGCLCGWRGAFHNFHIADRIDAWLREAKAEAWDEGHLTRRLRGPDACRCSAHSEGECGCGLYGTGELLSLAKNPYRD